MNTHFSYSNSVLSQAIGLNCWMECLRSQLKRLFFSKKSVECEEEELPTILPSLPPCSNRVTIFSRAATMKVFPALASAALLLNGASAYAPSKVPQAKRPAFDPKRAAVNGMAAASLASALVVGPMADAIDLTVDAPSFGSSNLVAERVTREGLYKEYDVDVGDQVFDDARSTYKSAKETKGKKGETPMCYASVCAGNCFASHTIDANTYL